MVKGAATRRTKSDVTVTRPSKNSAKQNIPAAARNGRQKDEVGTRQRRSKYAASPRKEGQAAPRVVRRKMGRENDFLTLRKIPPVEVEQEVRKAIMNLDGNLLAGVLHQPLAPSRTLVIVVHGFLSRKDQTLIRQVCVELSRCGVDAYRFDLSGNGDSEGRFEDATPKKMLRDISAVVEHFRASGRYTKFILAGHSMGGMLSILAASRMNLHGVVAIAAPARPERFEGVLSPQQKEQLKSVGFAILTLQTSVGPVPYTITEQFVREVGELPLLEAAKEVHCPVLVIQGSADRIVPLSDAEELAAALYAKDIYVVGGADHNFTNPQHLDALVGRIISWVRQR